MKERGIGGGDYMECIGEEEEMGGVSVEIQGDSGIIRSTTTIPGALQCVQGGKSEDTK